MSEKLREHIFMGMGKCKGETVCISVAYNLDYCIKKAEQFERLTEEIKFTKVRKIRIGELEAEEVFDTKGNLL